MNIRGSIIWDARILGKSIGLTFNKVEAEGWLSRSMSTIKELVPRKYDVPQYGEIMARLSSK